MAAPPVWIVEADPVLRDTLIEILREEGFVADAIDVDALRARLAAQARPPVVVVAAGMHHDRVDALLTEVERVSHPEPPRALILWTVPRGEALAKRRRLASLRMPFAIDELLTAVRALCGDAGP